MKLSIDGVDYSEKINISGYKVTPVRKYGPARGELLDGGLVPDLVSIKKNLSVVVVHTEQSVTSQITTACMKEKVSIEFDDPISNTVFSSVCEPEIGSLEAAIEDEDTGKKYWYEFEINFTEI